MVVQHNLTAMNSNRMLNVTTGAQAKSTEKLSSGYKINRAADDAAGLSISEKMRRQIRGLTQASANAQDGISSVQTAEGALTEVHDMLQRMDELATKAANGTLSEDDRNNIQDEIDQLLTEVDRVSETTKFNETYLLKGNAEGTSSRVNVDAHDAGLAGKLVDNGNTATFKLDEALKNGDKVTIGGKEFNIVNSYSDNKLNSSTEGYANATTVGGKTLNAGDSVTYNGSTYTLTDNIGWDKIKSTFGTSTDTFTIGGTNYTIAASSADETATALTQANAVKKIGAALAAGDDVKITKMGAAGGYKAITSSVNLVQSLSDGQVSSYNDALTDTKATTVAKVGSGASAAVTLSEGDSVSIGGEVTTATTMTPESAKTIAAAIEGLTNGNTVTIGTGDKQKIYTVADTSDESSGKLTKKDILSKIDHLEEVSVNGAAAKTVIGSTRGDSDSLTATDAYKKMAEELKKASSIGADNEATVQNLGNGAFTIAKGNVVVKDGMSFDLHVGSDADMTNKITVKIDSMNAAGLGIKGLNVKGSDGSNATYAIDAIENAIKKVSSQRSSLGAAQNRLEHTIKNVDNVVENTTSAESSIRDTDMATEMVQYSKNNILAQAGQSMLAQANQSNQGVLSLLG